MTKHIKKWIIFLAFIGVVLGGLFSCRFYDDRVEIESGEEWRLYTFDSESIIESLDKGKTNVFTEQTQLTQEDILKLISTTPEKSSPLLNSASWGEDDYLSIAQVLHEQSWGESLGDQNLYNMSFHIGCSDVERGTFTDAKFKSYEVIHSGEEEMRIERWITIVPIKNIVYTTIAEYQPNVNNKMPIDLSHYQINAEEALQIAEENGGHEKRLEVDNACSVSVNAPGPDSKGWRVIYVNQSDDLKSLEVAVDPQNGKYRVIFPSN